jgi:hypothetical protein
MATKLQQLIDVHSALLVRNPYCYFELAYTKSTNWMAWICTGNRDLNPSRKVLACGQGACPETAAAAALDDFLERGEREREAGGGEERHG